jgi:Secretion system C-terminal sorting domain/FG-GAP-like repeat
MKKRAFSVMFCVAIVMQIYAQSLPLCPKNFNKSTVNTSQMQTEYFSALSDVPNKKVLVGNFKKTTTNPSTEPEELLIFYPTGTNKLNLGLWGNCGSEFKKIWSITATQQSPKAPSIFGFWNFNVIDNYCVGDFNGDGQDDILCINHDNGWSQLATYNSTNPFCSGSANVKADDWKFLWGNAGSDKITNWGLNAKDYFFAGDFDGDGKDELLCTNEAGWWHLYKFTGSAWTYLGGASPATPYFEGSFLTSQIRPNKTVIGQFITPNPFTSKKEMIYLANDFNQYVLAYFQDGGFYPYFRNCSNKILGNKPIGGWDEFWGGQFDGDDKLEIIRYNRKWRFDMTTNDFGNRGYGWDINCNSMGEANFKVNGRVDFTGFNENKNPKYFEKFKPIFGRFTQSNKSSVLLMYYNNSSQYNWGNNLCLYTPEVGNGGDWFMVNPNKDNHIADNSIADGLKEQIPEGESQSKNISSLNLNIFPNPAKDNINIYFRSEIASTNSLIVKDAIGKEVSRFYIQTEIGDNNFSINLSNIPSGLYYITLHQQTTISTQKLIIR